MTTRETIVGSAGLGGSFDKHPRLLNNVAGTKLKVVQGYKNGNEINLAMERGEVEGRCGWPMTSILSTRGDWVADRKLNFIVQVGLSKHPDLGAIPLILDMVTDAAERAAVELAVAEREIQRPVLAPPEVPMERVIALRKAFMATMNDPEFQHEMAKRKLTIMPTPGEEVQTIIKRLNDSPVQVRNRAKALLDSSSEENCNRASRVQLIVLSYNLGCNASHNALRRVITKTGRRAMRRKAIICLAGASLIVSFGSCR